MNGSYFSSLTNFILDFETKFRFIPCIFQFWFCMPKKGEQLFLNQQ